MSLPFALERKYPNANREWLWQSVFPASQVAKDPRNVSRNTVFGLLRSFGDLSFGNPSELLNLRD